MRPTSRDCVLSAGAFRGHPRLRPARSAHHGAIPSPQVRSVVTPGYDTAAQADLLRIAAAQHTRISREAADGMGFDRHLFALRGLAASRGEVPEPALFTDPTYAAVSAVVSANELSTSTARPACMCSPQRALSLPHR